ncbi:hypothetical protein C8F01DRAFT_1258603 [Mycena amicta]|nr:hypothetical protein C8F01DRAFT_1258603 [Mycena amicta]
MAPQAPGFTQVETLAMLAVMLENKDKDGTGNGWKPQIWPKVLAVVNTVPNTSERTTQQCQAHNTYIKGNFEMYCTIANYSGTDWDDEEKYCVVSEDFQETFFCGVCDKKYRKCFITPCKFYDELYKVYDGARNKATGENVVLVGKNKTKKCKHVRKENKTAKKRGKAAAKQRVDSEDDAEADDKGKGAVNEDLTLSSLLKVVTVNARSTKTPSSQQPQSKPNLGGAIKRNSEAAMYVADTLSHIGDALKAPVTLKEDTSHIDAVINILTQNDTLLPDDEDGSLYDLVSNNFGANPNAAHVFIKTENPVRRKAIINGILKRSNAAF